MQSADLTSSRRAAFGRRLRSLRVRAKMTQQALATAAGLDRSFLSEVESGKHGIAVDRAYLLADALGVPITLLLTEDDTSEPDTALPPPPDPTASTSRTPPEAPVGP